MKLLNSLLIEGRIEKLNFFDSEMEHINFELNCPSDGMPPVRIHAEGAKCFDSNFADQVAVGMLVRVIGKIYQPPFQIHEDNSPVTCISIEHIEAKEDSK